LNPDAHLVVQVGGRSGGGPTLRGAQEHAVGDRNPQQQVGERQVGEELPFPYQSLQVADLGVVEGRAGGQQI